MTDTPTPPPHLLKKFSAEAHAESSKRNGAGYLKTFARLCIEWANSKSSPNSVQIRSSDIVPPPELVQQWWAEETYDPFGVATTKLAACAAQWGADLELGACCALMDEWGLDGNDLMECRRPRQPSLKQQALQIIDDSIEDEPGRVLYALDEIKAIRRALENLPDD